MWEGKQARQTIAVALSDCHKGAASSSWIQTFTLVSLRIPLHSQSTVDALTESDKRIWQMLKEDVSLCGAWGKGTRQEQEMLPTLGGEIRNISNWSVIDFTTNQSSIKNAWWVLPRLPIFGSDTYLALINLKTLRLKSLFASVMQCGYNPTWSSIHELINTRYLCFLDYSHNLMATPGYTCSTSWGCPLLFFFFQDT